jgi:lambda repressor-like predicted transcriptional regulator
VKHGNRSSYVAGCRCEPCRQANRDYARNLERRHRRDRYGIQPFQTVTLVDPKETRRHLAWLNSQGIGLRTIVDQTGLSRSNLQRIVRGDRKHITARTADRILAIGLHRTPPPLVDADQAWAIIATLNARGLSNAEIARRLGHKRPAVQISRTRVRRETLDRLRQLL